MMRFGRLLGFYLGSISMASATDEHVVTVYSSAAGSIDARTIQAQAANPDGRYQIPGYAIVRTSREMEIPRGIVRLAFSDVAAAIDPTTVTIESLDSDHSLQVLEQSFDYDLVSSQRILERYLGEVIDVETERETVRGSLLAARGNDLVLQLEDGQLVSIGAAERNLKFPALPEGLITKPTLRWMVNSSRDGSPAVRIGYETRGMTWWADYNLQLAGGDKCTVDVAAWVTMVNQSGAGYPAARLKLVAGDVNRAQATVQPMVRRMAMAESADVAGFEEKALFEYHLYTLGRPVDLPDRSMKQIELFPTVHRAPCVRALRFGAANRYPMYGNSPYTANGYPFAGRTDVAVHLTFDNREDSGLGIPLPRGRVRVSQADDADGSLEFIGEDRIDHTPRNETVDLRLGNAFDVLGERRQADFRWSKNDQYMIETVEVDLTNRKDSAVTIEVRENLYRWSQWSMIESTHPHQRVDAATIDFDIEVDADDTTTLRYTVRYDW